jgi:addiction module HigA family antidote
MRMKYPPHPGKGIKMELEHLGVSIARAASALGVSRQQLNNVISGKSAVSAEMAVRLERGIGGTADLWLAMQAAYDLAEVTNSDKDLAVQPLVPTEAAE